MKLPENLDELLKHSHLRFESDKIIEEKVKKIYEISRFMLTEGHTEDDSRYVVKIKPDAKSAIKYNISGITISYSTGEFFADYFTVHTFKRRFLSRLVKDTPDDNNEVLEIRFSRYPNRIIDANIDLYRPGVWEDLLKEEYTRKYTRSPVSARS